MPPPAVGSIESWVLDYVQHEAGTDWVIEPDPTLKAEGMIDGPARTIYYDPRVAADIAEFRRVLAHELGHFKLHPRLLAAARDPLGEHASEDLAGRTSRFDWEEADAEAFAYELLCPA